MEMKLCATARNPVPDLAEVEGLETPDRVRLRVARWPSASSARGTVVLLQGRSEYIEKYFEVVTELRGRGFDVVGFDWRGQGLSDRLLSDVRKGYVQSFGQYDLDFQMVFEQVVHARCAPPYIVLAHSTGGAVGLHAVQSGRHPIDRLILTSPMIGLPFIGTSVLARLALRAALRAGFGDAYVPGGGPDIMDLRPFAGNKRTSDPDRYARGAEIVTAAPSLGLGSPTIGWTAAAVEAVHALAEPDYPSQLKIPCLLITAGSDEIVSTPASTAFAARSKLISLVTIAGARHELLMERDGLRAQFWTAFDSFLGTSSARA